MLLLIILLVLLFGGGGGYYGYSRWGRGGGLGVVAARSCLSCWLFTWSAGYVDPDQIALNPKERQSMKQSTKDKAKGKFHEVKGKAKKVVDTGD